MDRNIVEKNIEYAGRNLSLKTGKLAGLADGAVLARYGETMVLATAVFEEISEKMGFLPLRVDYEEKLYAGGKIKGSRFVKREGRPSDEAILKARAIDRSVRPLFPKGLPYEIQIIITVLSVDSDNDPTILSLLASSAALSISGVPWNGPVTSMRIGLSDSNFILNPLQAERKFSDLDLLVTANERGIVMLEGHGQEVPEEKVIEGLHFAQENAQPLFQLINDFTSEVETTQVTFQSEGLDPQIKANILSYVKENFPEKVFDGDSRIRQASQGQFLEILYDEFEGKCSKLEMEELFKKEMKQVMRKKVLQENQRFDGRRLDEVRPVEAEIGLLPRTHGSALFTRGNTQVLTVTTLASTSLEQLIETMTGEKTKRYIHHYNFLPFSTGEVRRLGYPKRREIGHGALAEKSLLPVVPSEEDFPYTIRVVSEVLSSAGSTSQASICGSSLSLMDAGVPIRSDVAGVAMGLIKEGDQELVLSDIAGLEDFLGDMDLKVAGTETGVTGIQLDVKLDHVSTDTLGKAITQSRGNRLEILEKMRQAIQKPHQSLSEYAPHIVSTEVDPEKIGKIIGPGGETIRGIQEETETTIDIKEDGRVFIAGRNNQKVQKAKEWVSGLGKKPKVGKVYEGTVTRVLDFGAFVEILPKQEGLVHISEISTSYIEDIHQHIHEGDEVKVKVISIDEKDRVNLSIKQVNEQEN